MRRALTVAWVLWLTLAATASGDETGWWRVVSADAALDLPAARGAALAAVAADPLSAEAVAAAAWWLANLDYLSEPEALLTATDGPRDPALGFLLARLEAELSLRPPAGSLTTVEISGPFGVFDTLDLERGVVPGDSELPEPGTRYRDDAHPFRLRLRSLDGWAGPPEGMLYSGVYLAAWSLELTRPFDGWLVVEVAGSAKVELDGREVDHVVRAGRRDSAVRWYRVGLDAGRHRLRVPFASSRRPEVRASFFDTAGQPVSLAVADGAVEKTASSTIARSRPQSLAALDARIGAADADLPTLLLGATTARAERDLRRAWDLIGRALAGAPEDPQANLDAATLLLEEDLGLAPEVAWRRAREHLARAGRLPLALLAERALALRERRQEDAERLLDRMVDEHGDDARVLVLWVTEAVRRGWVREAQADLERLGALLPGSRRVAELRIEVAEAQERWNERLELLRALAASEPEDLERVDQLAASCLADEAIAVLDRLRERADDAALDSAAVRLRLEAGRVDDAAAELAVVRARWGGLQALDELGLALAAARGEPLEALLDEVLERRPADLQLLSLAWRLGAPRFFEPFRVDALALARERRPTSGGVDAELLLDQAVERIFPDGSSVHYYHGMSRAVTPEGVRQASVLQQLPGSLRLRVRIIKPDGTVVVPPEVAPDRDVFSLADVEPGDLVEEEYVAAIAPTGASRRGHMSPYIYRFADADRAFGLSEYVLLAPPGVEPEVEGRFVGLEHEEWEQDGLRAIRWRAERMPPVPQEPFAPPAQELLPWVTYGFGVSWQDVGDVVRDRFLPLLDPTSELADLARSLPTADPGRAVAVLADALEARVKPGRRGLDVGAPAGEVLSRGEGSRLVVAAAALIAADWQVDLVLARPRVFAGSHLAVPTLEAFSTPVLRVAAADGEVWYDVDEGRRGAGRLRAILQGSDALVLPLSRPTRPVERIGELPEFPNPDLEEVVLARAELGTDGTAGIHFELTLRGTQGARLEETLRGQPPDRQQVVFRQIAVGLFPGADQVRGRLERVEAGLRLELELVSAGACELDGPTMACRSLVLGKALAPALASLAERTFPLVLHLPILQRYELELVPPPGWSGEARPRRLETRWGSVHEELEVGAGRVRSVLRLELPAQTVDPADYPEFARFCHAVDELVLRPPVLRLSNR